MWLTSGALSDKYCGKLGSDITTRQARLNGEALRRVAGTKSLVFNPLNAELNPICHLLALLGAHHIFHVNGLRVKWLYLLDSGFLQGVPQDTARPLFNPTGGRGVLFE